MRWPRSKMRKMRPENSRPGSTGACKDAWDDILKWQLDSRHRPCNLVELMPRLKEHLKAA